MSEQPDESQKTEDPTQKRLDDARKKGDSPKSTEINSAMALAAVALAITFIMPSAGRRLVNALMPFLDHPQEIAVDSGTLMTIAWKASGAALFAFLGIGLATLFAGVAANVVQTPPVLTTEKMKPSFKKISPLAGAKRLLGPEALVNFAKGLAKLTIIGILIMYVLWPDRDIMVKAMAVGPAELLLTAKGVAIKIVATALAAMVVIAALDYLWQRHSWLKRQRMTQQQVRDENKDSEGDPHIKARVRAIRQERARRRMMAAVPNATVVVMNPTHYAVALKYEEGQKAPPVCVAKGRDAVALRIRDVARENGVPVVVNPPLARALHASVEIDEEIPFEHYQAVAKLIGFVYRKARRRRPV